MSSDYFSEYSSFIGSKGLPSPADTPYETPGFLRSARSSRGTRPSSREASVTPPPLPPDSADVPERTRDGRYSALDPRRFTPTLHASLVSEILNLRRELDSKHHLIESLESSLQTSKTENEDLGNQLSTATKDVRAAKQQLQHLERGTYEAVEDLVKERDAAKSAHEDVRTKLDAANKNVRRQEEEASRSQGVFELEKEKWDNERRQLERRVHVTETRLRAFVEEMSAQQAAASADTRGSVGLESGDEETFQDSGLGNDSDTASVQSHTGNKHRRNKSSVSFRSLRRSHSGARRNDPKSTGFNLADELGIDEEDEYDLDEFEHDDDELVYDERTRRAIESRQSSHAGEADSKAMRVLGLSQSERNEHASSREFPRDLPRQNPTDEITALPALPTATALATAPTLATVPEVLSPVPVRKYVDTGVQPSPPPTPPPSIPSSNRESSIINGYRSSVQTIGSSDTGATDLSQERDVEPATHLGALQPNATPLSPPETPRIDSIWAEKDERPKTPSITYCSTSTQTETPESPTQTDDANSRQSPTVAPLLVPSIAIHPPTSRPSSPREAVLPPGTRNASCQVDIKGPTRDASIQTEEIRIDMRNMRFPSRLLPAAILTAAPSTTHPMKVSLPSPPIRSPTETSPTLSRDNSNKDLRTLPPLRAIPLPRPVLSPPIVQDNRAFKESAPVGNSEGPLNRAAQYGVTRPLQSSKHLAAFENDSDSDYEDPVGDSGPQDLLGTLPSLARPHGRFGLSEPPKAVPEDKEISPERRPQTSGSQRSPQRSAAPAPSVAGSINRGAGSQRSHGPPPAKMEKYTHLRSRSPSFGSMASSSYSAATLPPPFPIPTRSSSRIMTKTQSEGSQSPTPLNGDVFGPRSNRGGRGHTARKPSLRKVQSAAVVRPGGRTSPQKSRRRRVRSPQMTPIQSMAFDSPAPTHFPIPELPTPLHNGLGFDYNGGSQDATGPPGTADSFMNGTQDTSLVDAIAATMVGEWIWKYVRKRKSFGGNDEADHLPQAGGDGSVNITGNGVRHKRWVWLSPYERTVMWSNKQPTSGSALLGKNGRKLTIQSVLDVKDDTPVPKGAGFGTVFNRSILILTPTRALKFTATNKERHGLWMTALSFLGHSSVPSRVPTATAPAPAPIPLPTAEYELPKHLQLRRGPRDSVRVAKSQGRGGRPSLTKSVSAQEGVQGPAIMIEVESPQDQGADPPMIPRLYNGTYRHQRKRSNTSPRLPAPLHSLRSFSSNALPPPASSNGSSSRRNLPSASSNSKSGSRRGSIASPPADQPNFFEAVGTVRMEAFVDPSLRDGVLYVPPLPEAVAPRRRRGDSNLSAASMDKRRAGYVFDENGIDPFKGF